VAGLGDRFDSAQVDASDVPAIVELLQTERADAVLNAW
jgi:saccharopine dehydrogenase-like NADP-dependent oxidoreductase